MKEESALQPGSWLEPLGLVGLQSIEAPLLAALVTELPLLLIGPHGQPQAAARLARVGAANASPFVTQFTQLDEKGALVWLVGKVRKRCPEPGHDCRALQTKKRIEPHLVPDR